MNDPLSLSATVSTQLQPPIVTGFGVDFSFVEVEFIAEDMSRTPRWNTPFGSSTIRVSGSFGFGMIKLLLRTMPPYFTTPIVVHGFLGVGLACIVSQIGKEANSQTSEPCSNLRLQFLLLAELLGVLWIGRQSLLVLCLALLKLFLLLFRQGQLTISFAQRLKLRIALLSPQDLLLLSHLALIRDLTDLHLLPLLNLPSLLLNARTILIKTSILSFR